MTKRRRIGLVAIAAVTAVLGASTFVWWRVRGPQHPLMRPDETMVETSAGGPRGARIDHVLALSREKGLRRIRALVDVYVRWSADESALEARKLALNALFSEPALGLKLRGVLDAVAGDPAPPEDDPLWSFLVGKLAEHWTLDVFDKGRDLMLMESRPRARRALVASWTRLAEPNRISKLTSAQRHALASDLVDVYGRLDGAQTPEVLAALRALSGDDVADIMAGRAFDPDFKLQAELEQERAIERVRQAMNASKP